MVRPAFVALALFLVGPAKAQSTLKPMTGAELLSYSEALQTMYVVGYLDRALGPGAGLTPKQTAHYVECVVNAGFTNGTLRQGTVGLLRSDPALLTKPASISIWTMLLRACGAAAP